MTNPLLTSSELPCSLPDLSAITDAQLREAVLTAVEQHRAALDEIGARTDPATAENTLHPAERALARLWRAIDGLGTVAAADATPGRQDLETELAPVLAQHDDAEMLHPGVQRRLEALRDRAEAGEITLDGQDAWLLAELLRERALHGAALPPEQQARLQELNIALADAETAFSQAVLKGRNAGAVHVTDAAELDGLSADELAGYAEAAKARGLEGYLVDLVNTTGQPVLARLHHRGLRERVFRAAAARGAGGEHDTRAQIIHIARLRQERAELLGYPSTAELTAARGTAGTAAAVRELLTTIGPAATRNAAAEAELLAERFAVIAPDATFAAWDWAYVENIVRSEKFTLDESAIAPYLEYGRVLTDGVLAAAELVYGLTFAERPDLPGYTPDTRVFEVRDEDGSLLGLALFDPYTSETKLGGAWMTSLVNQSGLTGEQPVVTNTTNFPRPQPGKPCLLTWDNVVTMFHEFGHALHGLLSQVRYPSRSGTAVPRDVVEFPSQVNEMWATEPAILARFARHHETGEAMPSEWVTALQEAASFGDGFASHEAFSAMILDQAWHDGRPLPDGPDAVAAFEEAALREAGVWLELAPPRYRSPYFAHTFGGSYAAGYYSYAWAEVLDADCVAWIREQGDDVRATGRRLRAGVLSKGGSEDLLAAYEALTGHAPDPRHLLERHHLA